MAPKSEVVLASSIGGVHIVDNLTLKSVCEQRENPQVLEKLKKF